MRKLLEQAKTLLEDIHFNCHMIVSDPEHAKEKDLMSDDKGNKYVMNTITTDQGIRLEKLVRDIETELFLDDDK